MRAFRRAPPEIGARVLVRPRLVQRLNARFERRLVTVTAPVGYGKTTLLAQAVYENALAPRGVDVWLSCEPADESAAALAAGLAGALGLGTDPAAPPAASRLAEAVWASAPRPVALVLDDVHHVTPGSSGAALLAELLEELPANGHLVLAGRTDPPVPTARLASHGAITHISGPDLLFDAVELDALASLHGMDGSQLVDTGGWAAMAALATSGAAGIGHRYVWDEVVARLSPLARDALTVLTMVVEGDAELVGTILGTAVDLDTLLAGVPLVARSGPIAQPHALWEPILTSGRASETRDLRRRAAAALVRRREVHRAGALLLPADDDADWLVLRDAIAEGCSLVHFVARADLLSSWEASLAPARRHEAEGILLRATVARLHQVSGESAKDAMREAMAVARDAGRLDAEWAALTQLAHIAWWEGDPLAAAGLLARTHELAALGVRGARELSEIGSAMLMQITHDYDRMLGVVQRIDRSGLDRDFASAADWLEARALINLGRSREAVPLADRAVQGFVFQAARMERLHARMHAGDAAGALTLLRQVDLGAERSERDRFLVGVTTAGGYALFGEPAEARRALAVARAAVGSVEGARPAFYLAQTETILQLCEGQEARAAAHLEAVLAGRPIDAEVLEAVRALLGLVYVLLPDRRDEIDALPHGPDQAEALAVARHLVAARAGRASGPVAATPGRVVGSLGIRLAVELAATTNDMPLAAALVELAPDAARDALAQAAASDRPAVAEGAKRLMRELPRPPAAPLRLRVLGPAVLERGGAVVTDADWRRERVRSLLQYLVARGRATREQVAAALWPGLDADAAAGNLRVTLGYLHRVLEPGRPTGSPPYVVQTVGNVLLLRRDALTVDAWELDGAIERAGAAEAAGVPSHALGELEAALQLWGGDYLADVYDDWAAPERDRLRARFLAAAVRAGELLVAKGDADRALAIATRAIEAEPWYEPAHRLAMAAHLARGDRAAARRALDRCFTALGELGVSPDDETAMLERRILTGG